MASQNLLSKISGALQGMNFPAFRQRFRDSENTKTVFILLTIGLMVIVVLQQIKINSQHERLLVTPPHLTEEAQIAWNSASQSYMNDFSLYLVSQISSATPSTADYIVGAMEPYFTPTIWGSLKPQILAIKQNPNYVGINPISNFVPTGGVIYEPSTGKIFVSGRLTSSAYSKGGMTAIGAVDATYELKMSIRNGLPWVTEWYAYSGVPRTLAWASKHPAEAKKDADERAQSIRSMPMVPEDEIQRPSTQSQLSIAPADPGQIQPDSDSAASNAANAADAAVQGIILPDGTPPVQDPVQPDNTAPVAPAPTDLL